MLNDLFTSIAAEVKMPSGRIDQPKIEDNRDGTVRVQYDPREEGVHELTVKYNGEHVQGKCDACVSTLHNRIL